MSISHKNEYDVGTNPQGTSTTVISDTYYDTSGTPVPQIQTTDVGKVLKATSTGPAWDSSAGGGVWGSITGTLSDQTDLNTALGAKVDLASTQTITGTKTFTNGGGYNTVLNGVRVDVTNATTSYSQSGSFQPDYTRGAYINSSNRWCGWKITAPTSASVATEPRSKIEHYVTRGDTQTNYSLYLPERSGTLAIANESPTWEFLGSATAAQIHATGTGEYDILIPQLTNGNYKRLYIMFAARAETDETVTASEGYIAALRTDTSGFAQIAGPVIVKSATYASGYRVSTIRIEQEYFGVHVEAKSGNVSTATTPTIQTLVLASGLESVTPFMQGYSINLFRGFRIRGLSASKTGRDYACYVYGQK